VGPPVGGSFWFQIFIQAPSPEIWSETISGGEEALAGKWGGLFLGYLLGRNYRRRDRDHLLPPRRMGAAGGRARVCYPFGREHGRHRAVSNCVVGSGGSWLPCSTIAEHSVEGCDHFSHDGDDDDLGFFVGGGEAFVEGFEGGTVTACAEGGHVEDV